MQNLRDKLLKAGLISEAQPNNNADSGPERRNGARPPPAEPPRRRAEPERPVRSAPIPKLPPLAVPNNKELQRLDAKKQVELDRRIRELVLAHEVEIQPGEQTFYFVTRKNRLRRMALTPELARRLESGELAVVERPEPAQIEHSIVPAATADQLLEWSSRAVRFYNRKDTPVGFLSDEELSRRQKAEATEESAARPAQEQDAASTAPTPVAPATPGSSHLESSSRALTHELALDAEHFGARSSGGDD